EAVIIRDLRVKVVSRAPAIVGTAIMRAADCGGTVSSRNYSVDLTASNPQLLLEDVHGEPTTDHQLYTVSKSDPEVFLLIGHLTDSGSVTYEYQVDWSQGSHSGTSDIVAPNGKPFAVTTGGTNPVYLPRDGQWAGLTKP
ncbi:MAG: hypothetical protein QOE61_2881, partial [Micromonosporaceae bacterium]|nr:hypothetical protein [Micromonosporaceae bacterium]